MSRPRRDARGRVEETTQRLAGVDEQVCPVDAARLYVRRALALAKQADEISALRDIRRGLRLAPRDGAVRDGKSL